MNHDNTNSKRRITVRALIFNEQDELLLVQENTDGPWCSLGGGTRDDETLAQALDREAYEEVGVHVVPKKLLQVSETLSRSTGETQLSFWFEVEAQNELPAAWKDSDGWVQRSDFFSREKLQETVIASRWILDLWDARIGKLPLYRYEEFEVFPWRKAPKLTEDTHE